MTDDDDAAENERLFHIYGNLLEETLWWLRWFERLWVNEDEDLAELRDLIKRIKDEL